MHVWSVDLDGSRFDSPEFRGVSSPDERQKALAIPSKLVRRRYLARKVFQRLVLADYLRIAPDRVSFSNGGFGKPGFAPAVRSVGLQFSASNSDSAAVLAVSRSVRVGIDIEAVRPVPHMSDVVEWVIESFDAGWAEARPTDEVTFFRQWTRLEAQVKYAGAGLARHDKAVGTGWDFKTALHDCAGKRFLLTIATRHSSIRIQGPFVLTRSRMRSCGKQETHGPSSMHRSRNPEHRWDRT